MPNIKRAQKILKLNNTKNFKTNIELLINIIEESYDTNVDINDSNMKNLVNLMYIFYDRTRFNYINHIECNRNTTNEKKLVNDISKLGKIDMIIFNTIKTFKNIIDHFEPKYKDIPFERRGIFKWTPNAMYVFGIGIPFAFAVATGSQSMFVVAIYTYISGWLHYFCTEKEDFKVIYKDD